MMHCMQAPDVPRRRDIAAAIGTLGHTADHFLRRLLSRILHSGRPPECRSVRFWEASVVCAICNGRDRHRSLPYRFSELQQPVRVQGSTAPPPLFFRTSPQM